MRERVIRSILRQELPKLREPQTTRIVTLIMREGKHSGDLPDDVADQLANINEKMWSVIEETRALNQRLKP